MQKALGDGGGSRKKQRDKTAVDLEKEDSSVRCVCECVCVRVADCDLQHSEDPLDCLSHGFASACHSRCESVACQTQTLGINRETVYLSVHLVTIALVALFMPLNVCNQLWYPPSQSANV